MDLGASLAGVRFFRAIKTARFAPSRAESDTLSYRATYSTGSGSPIVINEFMADDERTLRDPRGDYDDWIELRNLMDQELDLSGYYLSDNPQDPRKWAIPAGTKIPARG